MEYAALNLYADLMALVEKSEAFYFVDQYLDDTHYKIFSYRLASYTDFLNPGALECRGVMFEVDGEGCDAKPLRLASLPQEKFFNLNENPFTMNLDLSEIEIITEKADGSLISTYLHKNDIRLKSKTSIQSDQAYASMDWLFLPENSRFREELLRAEKLGFTVNMEWCSPDNRIVLGYEEPQLIVLSARDRDSGEYVDFRDIDTDHFCEILSRWTKIVDVTRPYAEKAKEFVDLVSGIVENDELRYYTSEQKIREMLYVVQSSTPEEFVKKIPDMTGVEGYVVRLGTGQFVKVKTSWYLALHHTKDSINSPRRLYEAVLEEATDDMRSMFHDDAVAIRMIEEMEQKVEKLYNHLVDSVERFYERNKHMERKEYAILGQKELDRKAFGLAMTRYIGRDVDYKDFMKRHWKEFGVKDEEVTEE